MIAPVWGVEAYLAECLESVLGQSHAALEILVVDDASPDGSRAIAEGIAARDRRVRVLTHRRNRGLGAARNTGAKAARGDYLFFLDSDDRLADPEALARLFVAARSGGGPVTIGACADLRDDGRIEPRDAAMARGRRNETGGEVRGVEALLASFGLPSDAYLPARAWGTLIERRFYRRARLDFPPVEHEDLAHTPFLYFAAGAVTYRPEVAVHYRVRASGLSNAPWDSARIGRYAALWQVIRRRLRRFGLRAQEAVVARYLLSHLLWRLERNNPGAVPTEALIATVRAIAADAGGAAYADPHFDLEATLRTLLARGALEAASTDAEVAALRAALASPRAGWREMGRRAFGG